MNGWITILLNKKIDEVLKDDSIEFIKKDRIRNKKETWIRHKWKKLLVIPTSQLDRMKFNNCHLHFKEKMFQEKDSIKTELDFSDSLEELIPSKYEIKLTKILNSLLFDEG